MAKYLVPFKGSVVIEATSWRHAEIVAITWRQSLCCRKTDARPTINTIDLTSSQHGITEQSSPEVQAVSLVFSASPFADVTAEIEARREQVVEDDRHKSQQRGLPETDLTDEQLILWRMDTEAD